MPKIGDLPKRLTTLDAGFLYLERPSQLLHIATILVFDGLLDYERVVANLQARLHLLPRYTDRVVPAPLGIAHPTWEPDPEFDIRVHVQHRYLTQPGDDAQLAVLCATLHIRPLNRNRPLWEVYVIDGYRGDGGFARSDPDSQEADDHERRSPRTVLYVKVHHCMIDGVSGVQLLGILLDASPRPAAVQSPGFEDCPPLPGFTRRLLAAVSDRAGTAARRAMTALSVLARPGRAIEEIGATVDAITNLGWTMLAGAPRTPLNGRIGVARRLAWVTFSLSETKAIKNRLGGSVNDVVLAVISGALRNALEKGGMNPDRVELRAVLPVNVRGTHEHLKIGNHISMMVAPLPVGILDPIERLRQVHAATQELKNRNESRRMQRLVVLLDLVPPLIQQLFGWFQGTQAQVNTICTNVPGPPIALYSQGVRAEGMVPLVPLADGIGITFAILSYADTLTIGVTADAVLIPDLEAFLAPLRSAFEELWAETGLARVNGENRVLPERQRRRATSVNSDLSTSTIEHVRPR